jgi:hypothetical protein
VKGLARRTQHLFKPHFPSLEGLSSQEESEEVRRKNQKDSPLITGIQINHESMGS